MMSWSRRVMSVTFASALTLITVGQPAQAAISQDSGWVYTTDGAGKIYFDADRKGYPGQELLIVCDIKADARGVTGAAEWRVDPVKFGKQITDSSSSGDCTSYAGNFIPEGYLLHVWVCKYHTSTNDIGNFSYCRVGAGIG